MQGILALLSRCSFQLGCVVLFSLPPTSSAPTSSFSFFDAVEPFFPFPCVFHHMSCSSHLANQLLAALSGPRS